MSKHNKGNNPQPHPNQNSGQGKECKWDGNARVSGEVGIQFPKDFSRQRQTEQEESAAHNKSQRLVNWLTFAVIVIYTFVSAGQWYEIRHDFIANKRAWVKVAATLPSTPDVAFGMNITNFGKSPAVEVHVQNWVEVVASSSPPSLNGKGAYSLILYNLLFPDDQQVSPTRRAKLDRKEDWPMTDDERRQMETGEAYLVSYGIATYRDEFGPHWTKFCQWQSYVQNRNFKAVTCTLYNGVGDGTP
jgi:hypothetical protein